MSAPDKGPAKGPIKGIVFDKDGTLFDFRTTWEAWAASFLRRASNGDEALATRAGHAMGFDLSARRFSPDSIAIAGTMGEIAQALVPVFDDMSYDEVHAFLGREAASAPQAEAVPLVPLLGALRERGLALGVATNDSETPARAHLDVAGITDLFDFIAGSDSGFGGKPAPGQLLAFCEQTGLTPETVIMVGDSLHDLKAGKAAGMKCLAVLTGLADHATLAPFSEDVLPDIGAIPAWLDERTTQ